MGTCAGLNSPRSPRWLITMTTGICAAMLSDASVLTQLPRPEFCMSRAPRWPAEVGAGEHAQALFFSRRRDDGAVLVGPERLEDLRDDVVGHGGEEADVVATQRIGHVPAPG